MDRLEFLNKRIGCAFVGLTRTGYTFKGWGTKSTGGTIFDQNDKGLLPTEINTNINNGSVSTTLYAIWEKGCAVHTPANAWSNNSEYHWHICTVAGCGAVIDNSKRPHTPDRDAATETDPIKCSICDYVITPTLGHTHAHGNEWKSDDNNHWKECTCGNKANVLTHTDTDKDGKCDVCKYNVGSDVTTDLAGDISGDGIINAIDVLNIRRYVVGGWNVAFDMSPADVTDDGFVNSKDAVKIRRSISGGW